MAYDGSIVIGTQVDTTGAEQGLKRLEKIADVGLKGSPVGQHFVSGIAAGALETSEQLDDAMRSVILSALEAAKKEGEIHSPSCVFRDEVGKMLVAGIAEGIMDNEGLVRTALDQLNQGMLESERAYLAQKEEIDAKRRQEDSSKRRAEYEERLRKAKNAVEREKIKAAEIARIQREADDEELRRLKEKANNEKSILNALKQDIKAIYSDIAKYATQQMGEVLQKQQGMEQKLASFGTLTDKLRFRGGIFGKEGLEVERLRDFSKDIATLEQYRDALLKVKTRVGEAFDPETARAFFEEFEGLSVEEGAAYAKLLADASDEYFAQYIDGWRRKQEANSQLSAELYVDEWDAATKDVESMMKQSLEEMGLDVPEGFFASGSISAKNFGTAFVEELDRQLEGVRKIVEQFSASLMPQLFLNGGGAGAFGNRTVSTDNSVTNFHVYGGSQSNVEQIQNIYAQQNIKKQMGVI